MQKLIFDHALLPEGWAQNVGVDIQDGVIRSVDVGATPQGRARIAGIALPGLPNLHSHTFQRGMAGLAETRGGGNDSFWSWRQLMYRFLGRLTPDDIEALAAQAFMEMLEAGFTSVAEFHYLHHDLDGRPYANLAELSERIVAAASQTNIGLTLLPSLYGYGGFGGAEPNEGQRRFLNDADRFLALVEKARAAVRPLPDARVGIAPHSLRAVTPELLSNVVRATPEGPIHIHVAEQVKEVQDCLDWSGRRPVEWLLDHAPVDDRWCLIHATHMTPEETEAFARSGAVAGLCPLTEASLGDGIFDGVNFRAAGGRFGVGSDSNIEITAPGELKQLEYSQRLQNRIRNALTQREGESTGRVIYDAGLAGGAQALGRKIGALAPGCRADVVVLDADMPELAAVAGDRWLDQYVFVLGQRAIATVLVGGEPAVEGGRHRERAKITQRFAKTLTRLASE